MCFVRVDGNGEVVGLVLVDGEREAVDDILVLAEAFPDARRAEFDALLPEERHDLAEEARATRTAVLAA